MQNVILHIGMHKTGTSSIQEGLSSYDDGSTKYARFDVSNHSIPITTIFSSHAHDYHIWKNQGYSCDRVQEIGKDYRNILERELSDASRKRLIISGEDIGILRDNDKLSLIEFFRSKDIELDIICFTRNPLALSSSSIQQHIRGGIFALTKINPSYKFRIECFRANLPIGRVLVRDYNQEISKHGDIVNAISYIYGLDADSIKPVFENKSLSLMATKLIFRLNKLPISSFGTQARMKARHNLIDFLSRIFPANSDFSKIDESISAGLISVESEDISYLKNNFGIDYNEYNSSRSLAECEHYFNNLRDLDLSFFRNQLKNIGVTCQSGDSIESMLIALYHHFLADNALHDSDAAYLRDIAIKIAESKELVLQDAVSLMALASRARPTGPFIKNKLKEYRDLLGSS